MLRNGRYGEAASASRALLNSNPGSGPARSLAQRAREMFEAEPFIASELTRARAAHERDDGEELIEACGRILALDPGHAEALGLMESARPEARDDEMPAGKVGRGLEPAGQGPDSRVPAEAPGPGGSDGAAAETPPAIPAWVAD